MARRVFFSFYYKDDSSRIQQVLQMGAVEGQRILSGQKWEEVKRRARDCLTKDYRQISRVTALLVQGPSVALLAGLVVA
jgi:hypothetical protein